MTIRTFNRIVKLYRCQMPNISWRYSWYVWSSFFAIL